MANVHTHTNEIPVSKPMTDTLLNYTPSSQITLYKEPVQVILWFYKQSERRWTRKQSQHITFFTRPQTQVRKLWCLECVPASVPPQRCLAQLADTICVSEGLHLCLLFWKLTLGDPQSLHVCAGKVTESLCVSTRYCEPLFNRPSTQYTHTVKIKVLQVHGVMNTNNLRKRWCGDRTLGRGQAGKGHRHWSYDQGHKVKWLNTICNSTCKWNDVSSTLESTPCLLFSLLYNQVNQSQTHQDYCLPQAISCPLSEQITAKVP